MLDESEDLMDGSESSQDEARGMLQALCDNGLDGSVENAAVALGRDGDLVRQVLEGDEQADDDLIIKVRGIAQERNIPIEE
jgi:hypothetical protein